MPKKSLTRQEIIDAYFRSIHPSDEKIPPIYPALLESGSLENFSFSFRSELDRSPPEKGSKKSELKPLTQIRPMLHQTSTAEDILDNLRQGVTTAILGDPLGAGKTYEALWVYLNLRKINPNIGVVITVPDVVIPDWLDALSKIGINKEECTTIYVPSDIISLDPCTLSPILIVKQSLSLREGDSRHELYLEKMKAIYSLPRLHIFDENTSANRLIKILSKSAVKNPRLILSGTVVTNSIQDLAPHFEDSEQLGASTIKNLMVQLSTYFSRYHRSSFGGTSPAIPGMMFLSFLNLSTFTHSTLYSRMPSSLPILLPDAHEEFLCIDEDTQQPSSTVTPSRIRAEASSLLTGTGATVTVATAMNDQFLDSHSEHWYPTKLKKLIAESCSPRRDGDVTDILVITASQKTSAHLLKDLPEAVKIAKYTCINIHDKQREQKVLAARKENLSIIFITESARVEGFNVQEYLGKVIFFDAVRDAGDYIQASGRAVRRGNTKQHVEIKQYCALNTAQYVKDRLQTTRKAKILLELIQADPATVFMLLNQDILFRHAGSIRENVNLEEIILSMQNALNITRENLEEILKLEIPVQVTTGLIGLLSTADLDKFKLKEWEQKLSINPTLLNQAFIHLFLFKNQLNRFSFNGNSEQQLFKIEEHIQKFKLKFLEAMKFLDLNTLLQPAYLNLAYGFNCVDKYLINLNQLIQGDPQFSPETALNILKVLYSFTKEVFPERQEMLERIIHQLKKQDFFQTITFALLDREPHLLFAFIDANFSTPEMTRQLSIWFSQALKTNPNDIVRMFSLFFAYHSEQKKSSPRIHLVQLYEQLEQISMQEPVSIHSQIAYDTIAEYCGTLPQWIERLCQFAKTQDADVSNDISKRCTKLLKTCSKSIRTELQEKYSDFLSPTRQARKAEEDTVTTTTKKVTLASTAKYTQLGAAEETISHAAHPLSGHSFSFFQPASPSIVDLNSFASQAHTPLQDGSAAAAAAAASAAPEFSSLMRDEDAWMFSPQFQTSYDFATKNPEVDEEFLKMLDDPNQQDFFDSLFKLP